MSSASWSDCSMLDCIVLFTCEIEMSENAKYAAYNCQKFKMKKFKKRKTGVVSINGINLYQLNVSTP